MENQPKKRARGFAAMSLERRREVASKGGKIAQARGTAHQWTAEEASAAGKKGSARYARRAVEMEPPTAYVSDKALIVLRQDMPQTIPAKDRPTF